MSTKKSKSEIPVEKKVWLNWSVILLGLAILAPLLTIGGMLAFYLKDELEIRRTMAYLNFEQQGFRLREVLRDHSKATFASIEGENVLRFTTEPRVILQRRDGSWQPISGQVTTEELVRISPKSATHSEINVMKLNGQIMLSNPFMVDRNSKFGSSQLPTGYYLAVWNLDPNWFTQETSSGPHLLYLVNREAELLYSSAAGEVGEDFLKRPLVQEFVRSPLSRAGTALKASEGNHAFGFYMSVPDSNITYFVESSANLLFAPLLRPTAIVLSILLIIMFAILILLRDTFKTLSSEITFISKALDEFAKGYLIPTQLSSKEFLKELRPLVDSINKNTRGVRERVDVIEMGKGR